ncbi:MAG: exonuclease subunit SbcD [Alkalinema sp. CAN_BIN05]|nr:exonuclease subunit SbcD [Alkalinema sp. CAN_BIN05]
MFKVLHLSDIHMGSGYIHGRLNPETGLNTRFEDFVQTLSFCIDRAINDQVDLVLFGGDAFPDAVPAPYLQQAFAKQFCRLSAANIPTVLLVGNHDQHSQGEGGASLSIYRSLGVPNVIVGDTLTTYRIETKSGLLQVTTLPWLNRSTLMSKTETDGMSMAQVSEVLLDRLRIALEGEIRQLDPTIPHILLGHLMADAATFGAEKFLAVGKGFTVPLNILTRDCFNYVALGHVHKHQVLCENPLTIYPGSIERVDFSEEKEPKGFVMLEIAAKEEEENPIVQDSSKSSKTTDRQNVTSQNLFKTTYEFCPVPARSFCTIEINLCNSTMPQDDLLMAIHRSTIQDAVVRLIYHLRPEQVELIQDMVVRSALSAAHSYTIQADLVTQLSRSRLPELGVGATITPMEALQAYLINREDLRDLEAPILEAARALMGDEQGVMFGSSGDPMFGIDVQVPVKRSMEAIDFSIDTADTADVQLRLL